MQKVKSIESINFLFWLDSIFLLNDFKQKFLLKRFYTYIPQALILVPSTIFQIFCILSGPHN
jgi:hypothetical protein